MSERKLGIFSKIKEGENYNHPASIQRDRYPYIEYFEDYNLSLTLRLGKITVFGRALLKKALIDSINSFHIYFDAIFPSKLLKIIPPHFYSLFGVLP